LLAELDETAAVIASGGVSPRGRLRISAPLLFAQTAMGKIAAEFVRRYPEVRLRDRLVVAASPNLARPTENATVPVVVRGSGEQMPEWDISVDPGRLRFAIDPVLRLSSLVMIRDAVRAGVGAARLPVSLVTHDLAAGKLVCWGDVDGPDITLWALYPSRRLLSSRVSAFLVFLKEAFPTGNPDELAAYMGD
jgi:DNA-binding transcriptional LysR family regulator